MSVRSSSSGFAPWAALALLPVFALAAPSLSGQVVNGSAGAGDPVASSGGEGEEGPQSRRPVRRKRPRVSSVGYVDPAVIGTQFQLRFDRAKGLRLPDRAEFIYGKCGCFREAGFDPDAPGPSLPLDGGDPETTPFMVVGLEYTEYVLDAELAVGERFSVFAELPYRQVELRVESGPDRTEESGLADIQAGVKAGLIATEDRALTAQLRAYLPTGDAEKGLGTDHLSLEPGLLFFQQLTARLKLETELRYWLPIGGSDGTGLDDLGFEFDEDDDYAGSILRYGVGLGFDVNPEGSVVFGPVVEVVGWSVLGGLSANSSEGTFADLEVEEASGTNIVNVKIGANIGFGESSALFFGIGKALSDASHYDDIVRAEYRLAL